MIDYYSSIITISLVSLIVLCILVSENTRISKKDKIMFYLSFVFIAVAAFSEWLGIRFSERTDFPAWPLKLVKCLDYIFTPMAGGAIVGPMKSKNLAHKLLIGILSVNAVFQIIASFFGWMIVIGENGGYSHGPLYILYIILYLLVIVLIAVEFIIYSKSFSKRNRGSLYTILGLVILGILIQEFLGDHCRTAYIALTIGDILMYIRYTSFSQQTFDDYMDVQRIQIRTDALTGLLNRFSYNAELEKYDELGEIPENLTIFLLDINGLKKVNDSLGHEAGDELICGAAWCIDKVMGGAGKVYRIGGDEFVVISHMDRELAEETLVKLRNQIKNWHGKKVQELRIAAGYALASEHTSLKKVENLVREADKKMYADKNAYYNSEKNRK